MGGARETGEASAMGDFADGASGHVKPRGGHVVRGRFTRLPDEHEPRKGCAHAVGWNG
jgi:hypothetical protein